MRLHKDIEITINELMEAMNMSEKEIYLYLDELEENELIEYQKPTVLDRAKTLKIRVLAEAKEIDLKDIEAGTISSDASLFAVKSSGIH